MSTHDWLLDRTVEEYARVQFFGLYEYVRLFELYRTIQSSEADTEMAETESNTSPQNALSQNAQIFAEAVRRMFTERLNKRFRELVSLIGANEQFVEIDACDDVTLIGRRKNITVHVDESSNCNEHAAHLRDVLRNVHLCVRITECVVTKLTLYEVRSITTVDIAMTMKSEET